MHACMHACPVTHSLLPALPFRKRAPGNASLQLPCVRVSMRVSVCASVSVCAHMCVAGGEQVADQLFGEEVDPATFMEEVGALLGGAVQQQSQIEAYLAQLPDTDPSYLQLR
jgi:hypothetical protein